jgi:hypothetical protein
LLLRAVSSAGVAPGSLASVRHIEGAGRPNRARKSGYIAVYKHVRVSSGGVS